MALASWSVVAYHAQECVEFEIFSHSILSIKRQMLCCRQVNNIDSDRTTSFQNSKSTTKTYVGSENSPNRQKKNTHRKKGICHCIRSSLRLPLATAVSWLNWLGANRHCASHPPYSMYVYVYRMYKYLDAKSYFANKIPCSLRWHRTYVSVNTPRIININKYVNRLKWVFSLGMYCIEQRTMMMPCTIRITLYKQVFTFV